jgi:hypothetical protein
MKLVLIIFSICVLLEGVNSFLMSGKNQNKNELIEIVMSQVKGMSSVQDYMIHDVVILKFDQMKNFKIIDLCNDLLALIADENENSITVIDGKDAKDLVLREGGLLIIVIDNYLMVI